MRLFIAVELSELVVDWIKTFRSPLQAVCARKGISLRWTSPDQWHITLQFLGECSEAKIPGLTSAIKDTAASAKSFRLSLGPLGTFGGPRGGVLWLGVESGQQELHALSKDLQTRLASLGFVPEKRPFHGHVTLARARAPMTPKMLENLPAPQDPCPETVVKRLLLIRSELTPAGPIYSPEYEAPLF